eukprot:scaffold232049_cov27-Tisochrysis_lutea.AAC.1
MEIAERRTLADIRCKTLANQRDSRVLRCGAQPQPEPRHSTTATARCAQAQCQIDPSKNKQTRRCRPPAAPACEQPGAIVVGKTTICDHERLVLQSPL